MRSASTAVTAILALAWLGGTDATLFESFVKTSFFNGVNQVQELAAEDVLSSVPLALVYVTLDKPEQAPVEMKELALTLHTRTVPVPVYCAAPANLNEAEIGQILVYRQGRRTPYHGVRETSSILRYISTMNNATLRTITGKLDKVAFDNTKGTKVVGYFLPGSAELQSFEQAAQLFGAQVSFYVVTDPTVATHLKLEATGQIHLIREFDRQPVVCSVNPATLADIQQLIALNRDQLIKVTPLNVLDPALTSTSAIVLITDSNALSHHVLKLIAHTLRQHSPTTPTSKTTPAPAVPPMPVRILWLDTNDFPSFSLPAVVSQGHELTKLPALGFWNAQTKSTEWMDMLSLNGSPSDKIAEEANLLLVKAFLAAHPTAAAGASAQQTKTEL